MKAKFPFITFLALVLGLMLVFNAQAQESSPKFAFPPGVDWNNATPDQIADAVFNAVKSNPDAAPEIAVAGLQSAAGTGRWVQTAAQDGKQSVDPDGSAGDPGIEDIANVISDAASRANPAMAPQINSAIANSLSSLPPAGSGSSGGGDGGGGGGGGPVAPAPIPGGGGGGGGGSSTPSTSN
jgi:uncharacterized membrane protein YgcG